MDVRKVWFVASAALLLIMQNRHLGSTSYADDVFADKRRGFKTSFRLMQFHTLRAASEVDDEMMRVEG